MSEQDILQTVRDAPRESLPELIGVFARAQAEANARLLSLPAPKPQPIDEWLTTEQASEIFKVSRSFLYHPRAGISPRRAGRKLVFSRRELEKFLEANS